MLRRRACELGLGTGGWGRRAGVREWKRRQTWLEEVVLRRWARERRQERTILNNSSE